jgi:hypothetical protein
MTSEYAGDPNNFPEEITEIDDSDAPNATNFALATDALADRTAWLRDQLNNRQLSQLAAGNFKRPITTIVGPGSIAMNLGAVAWDAAYERWAALFQGSTGLFAYDTHSSGDAWVNLNSSAISANYALAGASDGNGNFAALLNQGTVVATARVSQAGTLSGPTTQTFLGNIVQGVMVYVPSGFASGYFMLGCQQSGSTFTCKLASSATGAGAWADNTSLLPTAGSFNWQTGTNNVAGFVSASDLAGSFTYPVVFGMCGITPGTDASRLLGFGSSGFVDITPSVLTGKCLTGLAYNAVLGLWGILCFDNGPFCYLYTSPDQATWTLQYKFAPSIGAIQSGGLACVGAVWAAHLGQVGPTPISGINPGGTWDRLMLSSDGGVTWTTASMNLGGWTAGPPIGPAPGLGPSPNGVYQFPRLVSNGNQLIAYNNVNHSFSLQVGTMPAGLI